MPTIDIPDKICPHCGGTKWYVKTDKYINKNGVLKQYISHSCIILVKERDKKWKSENPEKRKIIYKKSKDKVKDTEEYKIKNNQRVRAWYKLNKEQAIQNSKNAKLRNPEKYKMFSLVKNRKEVANLGDNYIKSLLSKDKELSFKDIPQQLVEIKRKQLLLTRQIKNNVKNN